MRIGVYLVDVLDEAHGYTFIADTYSGSDGNQPGVIDVKIRIVGINVMFLLLHLIMHATFGPIVLSGFTLICFGADNLGKIEPRAYTLVREMIDASPSIHLASHPADIP